MLRRSITPAILIAMLVSSTRVASAGYESAIGTISVAGSAQVNGAAVRSGQTVFTGSTIHTSLNSQSEIDFTNLARLGLVSECGLTLNVSPARLSAAVSAGQLRWFIPRGVTLQLTTADAHLQVAGDETTVFDVTTTECEGTTVSVVTGRLSVDAAPGDRVLGAGDVLTTASTAPPAFHSRKTIGIFILGGVVASLVLLAVLGDDPPPETATAPGGCIDLLSGQSNCH